VATLLPRVVLVVRETEYDLLLARHATAAQAEFFLASRGQSIAEIQRRHQRLQRGMQQVTSSIPGRWRRTRVWRRDLDRFDFSPEDIVVVVGQDGLVANTAKYLQGQPVVGVNPDPEQYDGVLVPHPPEALADLLATVARGRGHAEARTMVSATLDDGQQLLALNEIFVGVRSHQSARYEISFDGQQEDQSSSGLIAATGSGATGWARSIHRERGSTTPLPRPTERRLVFFVREAFPSHTTGTALTEGILDEHQPLTVCSHNNDGGVIFGDGIEDDYLVFEYGQQAQLRPAETSLQLVT